MNALLWLAVCAAAWEPERGAKEDPPGPVASPRVENDPGEGDDEYDCGDRALYMLLRMNGVNTNLVDIKSRLPRGPREGHSMKELIGAAGSLGFPVIGVEVGKDEGSLDRPMVVFLRRPGGGHFTTIRPVGHSGKMVQVIDSWFPIECLDKRVLLESPEWTGLALIAAGSNVIGLSRFPPWVALRILGLAVSLLIRKTRTRSAG